MGRGKIVLSTTTSGAVRILSLFFVLAGFYLVTPAARAQSANTWSKRGQDAEARQDYDAAFEDYGHAVTKKPKDLRYKAHYERVRYLAAVGHVDRGRLLKQSGDLNGATTEFMRAIQIDPSNQTAQQELTLIQQQLAAPAAAVGTQQMSNQEEVLKDIASVAGPVELKPVSDQPITLHMVEDVKNIYQAIGKAAGLNVLFDPDYTSKRIPVDLTNVSLNDALRIVGALAGTFYKPVTPNTIFVAQNNPSKRRDLETQAVQTFYLTNASQQADANEVQTAIRNVLDPTIKISLVPSQNAIVLRATPDQLLLAQKIINDLDRSRPEVVVDVAILEVNKDKTRNLGITLPQAFTLTPQASPGTTSSSSSSSSGSTTTPSNFTLNTLANLNASNFAVTLGGGTLNALLTDTDTRILQNPRIRATDGQRAQLKIGSRIPVATGSYNPGVATGVASIGVQTQFTYIDIGVNIDITPTVHYDREVTLKLKVEDLSHSGDVTISNVSEPIIGQRSVEQVIQLKDGEPSILAGILTQQDNHTVNGTPGIGELPFFKYLFATQSRERAQDEIVFLLIPHVVRESMLTRLNTRAVDTGSGQSIELRRDTSASLQDLLPVNARPAQIIGLPSTAANAANAAVQQMRQQAAPPAPPQAPSVLPTEPVAVPGPQSAPQNPAQPATQTGAQPSGPPISFSVVAPAGNQAVGGTFSVAISLNNARDVSSVPIQLQFNPAVLQLVNVDAGDLLGRDGQAVSIVHRDEGNGLVTIATSRPPNTSGISGQGNVARLTFKAVGAGDSNLTLVKVGALNSSQANLPATGSQAVVHVK